MVFDPFELSNYDGAPVRLYSFSRGAQTYRYAAADQDIAVPAYLFDLSVVNGFNTFVATAISDAGITQSGEAVQDGITIKLPWTTEVVQWFVGSPPSQPVYVRVFEVQADDPDLLVGVFGGTTATIAPLTWIGTVQMVKRTDPGTAEITCATLQNSFDRNGLRLTWGRTCPYAVYDSKTCKVAKADFATAATIAALDGANVVAAAFAAKPDGYFRGGMLEWSPLDGVFERRMVLSHAGDTVNILGITDQMTVGQAITAYKGCDRTIQMCNDDFDNLGNNGSAPQLPGQSPFDRNIF